MPASVPAFPQLRLGSAAPIRELRGPAIAAGSAAALVLGCLAGLAVSWQMILSDAARDRVFLAFTVLGYTATASAGQELAAIGHHQQPLDGMARVPRRLSGQPLALWPRPAAASATVMETRLPL